MIEGLRLLPWFQERIRNDRRSVDHLLDCERCHMSTTRQTRQAMGCGWEAPDPKVPALPWIHPGYADERPTTCVGYTAKLPEVIEINRARLHWKHGALREFCDGEQPSELLMRGIEVLEGSANEASCWREEEPK